LKTFRTSKKPYVQKEVLNYEKNKQKNKQK